MRIACFIILILMLGSHTTGAQVPLARLTPQNVYRLEQVGQIRHGTIEEMAWSPDGTYLATAGSAGVYLYGVETEREQWLPAQSGGAKDVDFSPNGVEVIAAGSDGLLRVWDVDTGTLLRLLNPYADLPCSCTYHLTAVKYSSDSARVWVGAENGPLRVIDAKTGQTEAEDARSVLEIVPDALRTRFAISEQRSGRLSIWPLTGQFAPTITFDMRFTVWNVAFVPQTDYLIVAGFVGTELALVNLNSAQTIDTVRGSRVLHVGRSGAVVTQIIEWIGGTRHSSVRVYDVNAEAIQFYAPLDVELTDARFSPSGTLLAVSDMAGRLTVWEWRRNHIILEHEPEGTALIGLAVLDGGLVASLDSGSGIVKTLTRHVPTSGQTVRLWDIGTGRPVSVLQTSDYGLDSADVLYWDKDFSWLVIGSTTQPDVQLALDPQTGMVQRINHYNVPLLWDKQYFQDTRDNLLRAEALSNDDVLVAEYGNTDNSVLLRAAGPALDFNTAGTLLLTTGSSGVIRLWGVRAVTPAAD